MILLYNDGSMCLDVLSYRSGPIMINLCINTLWVPTSLSYTDILYKSQNRVHLYIWQFD